MRTVVRFVGAEAFMGTGESLDDPTSCGRGMLEMITRGLTEHGIETSAVVDEDWGALVEVIDSRLRLQVCSGYRGDDWLIFIVAANDPRSAIPDMQPTRRILAAIHETLRAMPGIADVTWHRAADWDRGDETDRGKSPLED